MPTKAEQLTATSSDEDYRAAVDECIRQLTEEGRDQAQAQAICYSQAERAAGKPYPRVAEGAPRRRRGTRVTGAGVEELLR